MLLIAYNFRIIYSDDEEILRNEDPPELEMGLSNIIVVDNLPVVPPEKFEKLENVIRKIYSQIGVIKENGLWMPVNPDTKKTYGYCFIEYNTPQVVYFLLVTFLFLICSVDFFLLNIFTLLASGMWSIRFCNCVFLKNCFDNLNHVTFPPLFLFQPPLLPLS